MAKKDLRQHKTSKNWKLERNYRQIRNKDGQTIAYLITVEGQDITVTKEIYQAYSKADRRDRYLVEQDNHHGVTSYSDLGDSSLLSLEMSSEMSDGSMEESVIRQIMFKNLHLSLRMLTKSERTRIYNLPLLERGDAGCVSGAVGDYSANDQLSRKANSEKVKKNFFKIVKILFVNLLKKRVK